MLPGVELARKRRLHNHHNVASQPPDRPPRSTSLRPLPSPSAAEDPALVARLRLDGKLRTLVDSRRLSILPPTASVTEISGESRLNRPVENSQLGTSTSSVTTNPRASNQISRPPRSRALSRASSMNDICAVCLEEVKGVQGVMWLPCSHKYHSDCVLQWLAAHSHCPCCRTHVPKFYLSALPS